MKKNRATKKMKKSRVRHNGAAIEDPSWDSALSRDSNLLISGTFNFFFTGKLGFLGTTKGFVGE